MASILSQIDSLTVRDTLKNESGVAVLGSPWEKPTWATNIGWLENNWGYFMEPHLPSVGAALWGKEEMPANYGVSVLRHLEQAEDASRYFEVWARMSKAVATKHGWRAAAVATALGVYTVTLERWKEGTKEATVVEVKEVPIEELGGICIVDALGQVGLFTKKNAESKWIDRGGAPNNSAVFTTRYVGMGVGGHWYPSLWSFAASAITPETHTETDANRAATLDELKTASLSANWTKIPWAVNTGTPSVSGWKPSSFLAGSPAESRSGIYWNPTKWGGGSGLGATALRISSNSVAAERTIAVWAMMAAEANPTGYQAQLYGTAANTYTIKLREYNNGVVGRVVELAGVVIENTGNVCIVVKGGVVSVWVKKTSASAWEKKVEMSSSLFLEGYAGIDGNGSNPLLINFGAGNIPEAISIALSPAKMITNGSLAVTARTSVLTAAAPMVFADSIGFKVPQGVKTEPAKVVFGGTGLVAAGKPVALNAAKVMFSGSAELHTGVPVMLAESKLVFNAAGKVVRRILPGQYIKSEGKWVTL